MTVLAAAANARTFWYLTRGSGAVALLLLTASVLLGIVTSLRWRGERWPRFAITNAHRNLTLLSIAFVALHVVSTLLDGYAPIRLQNAVLPFTSRYRPIWLGLGAVAFDLLLALVVTSLLRARMPWRIWRGVHWLAYAAWPVALVHSLGTGSDARFAWMVGLGAACLTAVALAVLARVGLGGGPVGPRLAGAAAALLAPVAIFVWYQSGPSQQGWARRAGTPASLLARRTSSSGHLLTSVRTQPAPSSFVSAVSGGVSETQDANGLVTVHLPLRLRGGPRGAARIELSGEPTNEGVSMTASGVSFVPATTRAVYTGSVVALAGNRVVADVADAAGDHLQLNFSLSIDNATQTVSGVVAASTQAGDG